MITKPGMQEIMTADGSIMHVRDVMTEEMVINESNYDHYSAWEHNQYIGPNYLTTQWIWNYFWEICSNK